jgi:hypothetical protein
MPMTFITEQTLSVIGEVEFSLYDKSSGTKL